MEKATLTARDILEQLLDDDSDFSWSDSCGEKSMLIVVRALVLQLWNRTRAWTRQSHVSASLTQKNFIFTVF